MPVLVSEKVVTLEFDDLTRRTPIVRPAQPPKRTAGWHQSGVLSHIAHQVGILKPGEADEEDKNTYPILWALGQFWEEGMASFYPDMDWQPGELTVDEVSMTCDGLSLDTEYEFDSVPWEPMQTILEEFKFTFKGEASGEEFIKDKRFWMWIRQALGYCHGYGTRVCRWHVCHARGDYKKFGPTYKQYVVRFNDLEVRQNWSMIQSHKHLARPEGERKEA